MAPTNSLNIPEITSKVASYLEGKDLASCVSVSKGWHDVFLPHRWRVIRVGLMKENGFPVHIGPDRDHIYHHRHLIQDLSLIGETAWLHNCQYPNLRRLMLDAFDTMTVSKQNPMDCINGALFFVDLELKGVDVLPGFWETLSGHSHIRNLALSNALINTADTPGFWKTCMRLESLRIHDLYLEDGILPGNMTFERMRKLDMNGIDLTYDEYQRDLILQSPRLKSLAWKINSMLGFDEPARNSQWPPIRKLDLECCTEDMSWAFILNRVRNAPGNIDDLRLFGCELGTEASRALSTHFSTLVRVDLGGYWISSCTPLDLLCYCPRLEVLKAQDVTTKDITERGPWVCQQLRELRICLRFHSSDQGLQQLVFERISTLVQLEKLTAAHPYTSSHYDGLEFRLDCGLGQLATLQQLSDITFGGRRMGKAFPQLGMEEVAWMVDNWKKLKRVEGPLNGDKEVKARLVNVFESHGINVQ